MQTITFWMKLILGMFIFGIGLINCSQTSSKSQSTDQEVSLTEPIFTLGQWSFHRQLFNNEISTFDFIKLAAENDFHGVELVNQFFLGHAQNKSYLDSLKQQGELYEIAISILIIDQAGNLGDSDPIKRVHAINQHKLWIEAAQRIGSPFVRINVYGDGSPEEIKRNSKESVTELGHFAEKLNIDILIENHGAISNNGKWLSSLVQSIGMENVSLLADFDNWCIERENGQLWGAPCINRYDRYLGMKQLLPFAKAVSVKSFAFDELGNETSMDYDSLFKIIKSHEFNGFLGIEYEGTALNPVDGIKLTRQRALQAWNNN